MESEHGGIMTFKECLSPNAFTCHAPKSDNWWFTKCAMKTSTGRAIARRSESQVTKFKPEEAGARDAEADAVIQYAKRVKDWPLLEKAIDQKIEDQTEFVGWWQKHVTPRKHLNRHNVDNADRHGLALERAEKLTGIKQPKVSKWAKRLKDRDGYRKLLRGVAHRAAMGEAINTSRGAAHTGEFERYTPAPYVEAVRKVLGEIDLDPASCVQAQKIVRAKKFFTIKTDGLKQQWHGRIFLNPPYHKELGLAFENKLIAEIKVGHVSAAILLVNNSTDNSWFRTCAAACQAICFVAGRIQFIAPAGEMTGIPMNGQAFLYYPDVAGFAKVFSQKGFGVVPMWAYEAKTKESSE
jgi:DNA N-6-adenine-methyltransferase (Dam)